ncbi:MAG: peptide ABC transporter substrate-binding protein [Acidimicrobiia bacterium]
MLIRRLCFIGLVCAALLAIPACSGSKTTSAATLRVGSLEPAAIDPALATDSPGVQVTRLLFEGLTTTDDRLGVVPAVAESWTTDPSGRTFTFILRDGVQFSNGQPVTTNDFVFAFDRLADPDTASPRQQLGTPIEGWDAVAGGQPSGKIGDVPVAGVRAVDARTLTITTVEPFALLPSLVSQVAFAPVPKDALSTPDQAKRFADEPIGNGPYRMQGPWQRGSQISLTTNRSYFGTPPVTPNIAFEISADSDAEYARFRDGRLDISEIPVGAFQAARKTYGERAQSWPTAFLLYLGMNVDRAPYSDLNLRRALSLSIDRAAIANRLLEGTATPATGMVPPLTPETQANACDDCRFDPPAAKALLGTKKYPKLNLYADAGGSFLPVLRAITDEWRNVLGIDVTIVERDATQLQDDIAARTLDGLFYSGWIPDFPSAYAILDPLFATNGTDNHFGYSSAAVDRALADARRAPNATTAGAALSGADRTVSTALPALPLVNSDVVYATSTRVNDFRVDVLGNLLLERVRLR